MDITGVTASNGIKVYQPGNSITTSDSDVQIIAITKAATPSLSATQPSAIGGNGGIPMTTAHEYRSDGGSTWTQATGATSLAAGTYQVRVKATGTTLASNDQSITLTAFTGTQEATPAATFTATGPDNGTLSNVTAAMKYSVDNGGAWTAITGTTMDITGVTASNGIKVYQPGNSITTSDSDVQIIAITKAATPSAGKTDCTTLSNNDGKLTGVTAAMEYKLSTSAGWTGSTGSDITGLANGTYQVRVKAAGTALASNDQSITLTAFAGTQEATPAAIFVATGPAGGTLGNVTAAMQYSLDDGNTWISITGTTMDITGVTATNGIKVYQPGNTTTTLDSDIQTIGITKASTPSLFVTQPSAIGGNGSIPMTIAHEYSADGGSTWTQATGTTSLAAGTYLVRVKAAGTALASDNQSITLTAFAGTQEATPAATFAATGPAGGTLSNVTAAMQYSLDDGNTWTAITGATMDITGVTAANGVKVYQPGNSTTTLDSDIQTIGITKAATPSLSATQPSAIGGKGSLPMTTAHEYSSDGGSTWTQAAGTTSLAAGTYQVRVKAAGTALASNNQSITLTAFTGTQEATPAASFAATGPNSGTLGNVTAAMQYSLDDGDTWTAITGTTMDITGVTTVNGIQVYKPGNSTTTLDSAIQTIGITKAAAPSLSATQPSAIGGNGSLPMTTAHEYSSDGGSTWTLAAGTTSLAAGTYQVRVKAAGMALASDSQNITIEAFAGTKAATPSATFSFDGINAGKLMNTTAQMQYSLDGSTWINCAAGNTDLNGVIASITASNDVKVKDLGNGSTTTASEVQTIDITQAAAPTSAGKANCTTIANNDGKLTGVTAAMEYKLASASAWTDGTGSDITGLSNGTYNVRVKASGTAMASPAISFTVAGYDEIPEATPTADVNYISEILTGLTADGSYAINSTDITTDVNGEISIENGWFGTTIALVKKGDGIYTINSDTQPIPLAARPAAPTCTVTQPSAGSATGIISGITTAMQYSINGGSSWTGGDGGDVTGLAPGTVLIREKATAIAPTGLNQTITITAYSAPPSGGNGGGSSKGSTEPLVTKIESGGNVTGTNVENLVKEGKKLTVEGKAGEKLVFDTEALKNIDGQTKDSVKVEIKDVSEAHNDQQPGKVVFSLTITAGGKHITSFGNGTATVSLPYELKSGEKAEDVTVWYLVEDGTMSEVPCTYDPAAKLATFKVNHFSLYVVGTADTGKWTNPFSDVKESSWYYDAVRYVSANELMQGTADTAFNPNAKTTRGMIVTILWRMENEPKAAKEITFTDVKSGKYYHDAVAWASEKGIVGGYSAEQFGPEDNITREQLAVILHNYAASKGYKTSASGDLSVFGDSGKVHSWSKDSLSWANAKGLINGTGSNLLNPLGAAERCQVAAILQRFMENIAK
jgi:hypothetical protein